MLGKKNLEIVCDFRDGQPSHAAQFIIDDIHIDPFIIIYSAIVDSIFFFCIGIMLIKFSLNHFLNARFMIFIKRNSNKMFYF